MTDNGAGQAATTWPLVKFQFSVKIGNDEMLFQEVTGLSSETQVIESRVGNSPASSSVKMPGIKKFSNVTLKKGIFKDNQKLGDLFNKIKMNTFERQTIVISLLDEANAVAMSWSLKNAFPVKISVSDSKYDGMEVAIETLELAHEGVGLVN